MIACRWAGRDNPRIITNRHTDVMERIAEHIDIRDSGYLTPCWVSDLTLNRDGYSTIRLRPDPVPKLTHRVTYEITVGQIPDGLVIDHLCRVRACVNPAHLEPVTIKENNLRGLGFGPKHAAQTHCIHGHEFTPENTTFRTRPQGGRECKACNTIRARARRQRKASA